MPKRSLYPDRTPGHQADQAERLAIADLRLARHLARRCDESNRNGDPCVIDHAEFPDTNHTSAWGIRFQVHTT